jgi:hypothetical protein
VFPKRLTELTTSAAKEVSAKARAAMMKQMKIDIAAIEAAVREQQPDRSGCCAGVRCQ